MTLRQFLKKLSATPRDWSVEGTAIRRTDLDISRSQCPVYAVAGIGFDDFYSQAKLKSLDLGKRTMSNIMRASDVGYQDLPKRLQVLRQALLVITGIESDI
jgi:hypothetical protein